MSGGPMNINLTVYGKPEPQGSMKAFVPKGWKRPILTSDNKDLKSYRQQLTVVAIAEMRRIGADELAKAKIPVELRVRFYFQRPQSKSQKAFPTCRPDIDKLVRSVADALAGIVYVNDSQITKLDAEKYYGQPERTEIEIDY
jgi:Holliday junction resolvase RusA-like endonuclease